MKRPYQTLDGRTLALDLDGPLAAFLARVEAAAADPGVDNDAMISLVFGPDNPILDHAMVPGHHMATRETLALPAYRAMRDLLFRKEVQTGRIDLDKLRARYSMSVTEAAGHLGISPSAVRQAIEAGRLDSWKEAGQHRLDPARVESLRVEHRGPPPALEVCVGNIQGQSFRFKGPAELVDVERLGKHKIRGRLTARWQKVAVIFGGQGTNEFCELVPAATETRIECGPFYVCGRFRVLRQVTSETSGKAPHEAWHAFSAE